MGDYAVPEKRKSKNDKRAKMRYNKYKKGGRHRADNVFSKSEIKES